MSSVDAIILVYDIENPYSLKRVESFWIDFIQKKMRKDVKVMLLGNKNDGKWNIDVDVRNYLYRVDVL